MANVILSDVIDIISGGTPKTSESKYWSGGNIDWLSINDFNNGNRFVYSSEKKITELALKESNIKLLNKGDVIISARGTVGVLAQIGKPMCFNQSCFGLRGKKELIDNDFLYYVLKNYIHNLKKKSQGSVFDTINIKSFDLMEIDIPNYASQCDIASVLSVLDQKIELNNRINAELEAMAKTLYDYWFVQFDFPNEEGKPYKSSGGKMVYNSTLKREIPLGWNGVKLSDIASITMGQSPDGASYNESCDGVIFFQGATDFNWRFPSIRQYTTKPNRIAKKGDILLSVRAPVGDINIADNDCCIGRGLAALNSRDKFDSFLFYVMKYFKTVFDRRNSEGTTFGSITKDDLYSLLLAYPPKSLLTKYENIVSHYNKLILAKSLENKRLIELRDWLLPMLMNGQVTVK